MSLFVQNTKDSDDTWPERGPVTRSCFFLKPQNQLCLQDAMLNISLLLQILLYIKLVSVELSLNIHEYKALWNSWKDVRIGSSELCALTELSFHSLPTWPFRKVSVL